MWSVGYCDQLADVVFCKISLNKAKVGNYEVDSNIVSFWLM
jgi:hypothetical protein